MRAKLVGMDETAGEKNIPFNMAGCQEKEDTPFQKLCRSRWATMIKKVYETDPLKCPKPVLRSSQSEVGCGGRMKIISFIEKKYQEDIIERILRHCGLWTEIKERSPPEKPETVPFEPIYVPIDKFLANFR